METRSALISTRPGELAESALFSCQGTYANVYSRKRIEEAGKGGT